MTFKKGQSGNPAGRPRGEGGRDVELRNLFRARAPELINKALSLALDGDTAAMKMALDRILPAIKPTDKAIQIQLPVDDLLGAGQAIMAGTASGMLTPEQGQRLVGLLETQRRLVETADLEKRIEALEKSR